MDNEQHIDSIRALSAQVEEFLARHGLSGTQFGLAVAKDTHIVGKLRAGQGMNIRRYDRIRAFMRDYDRLHGGGVEGQASPDPSCSSIPPNGASSTAVRCTTPKRSR